MGCKSSFVLQQKIQLKRYVYRVYKNFISEGFQEDHMKKFHNLKISDFGEVSDLLLQKYRQLKHQRLSLYLYIHESRIKNKKCLKEKNFGELNFMTVNHPILIHKFLLSIGGRIFFSATFYQILPRLFYTDRITFNSDGVSTNLYLDLLKKDILDLPLNILLRILEGYFKYFSYERIKYIFENINPDKYNVDSFICSNKHFK